MKQPQLSSAPPGLSDALGARPASGEVQLPHDVATQVVKSIFLDQAYDEYCRQREQGVCPDPDQFCEKFPTFKTSLRRLIEADRFLEDNAHLLGGVLPMEWPRAGDTFLGFCLQRELGRGAFARVFLATEPALGNRQVAVKISVQGQAEAEILGRLDHPHIVPVHSIQEEPSGLTVICMPYLGSATLCDVLDRVASRPGQPVQAQVILDCVLDMAQPRPPSTGRQQADRFLATRSYIDGIARIGAQLAEALAHVHSLGIYHRDLKPSNVLMSPDGKPMLLDFNLCFDEQAASHRLGGTLPYMSPEHLRTFGLDCSADPSFVGASSDLFSLAVILYELLTGQHPFGPIPLKLAAPELRQLLLERQRKGPPPLRRLNPKVDRKLAHLVERGLAYSPNQRPQSSGELAAALRESLSWPRRLRCWVHGHSRIVLGVVLGIALASTIAVAALVARPPYSQRQLNQGIAAYHEGRYKEAVDSFSHALEADRNLVPALFARGRAYQQLNRFQEAVDDYEQAAGLWRDGRSEACAGYCKSRLKLHKDAVKLYNQAVEAGYAPAEVFNDLGYSCERLGEAGKARESLDRAVALNDHLQAAFHNRLQTELSIGWNSPNDLRRSGMMDIQTALALGPETAQLDYDAACYYALAARTDGSQAKIALQYLHKALDLGWNAPLSGDAVLKKVANEAEFRRLSRFPVPAIPPVAPVLLLDPVKDSSP